VRFGENELQQRETPDPEHANSFVFFCRLRRSTQYVCYNSRPANVIPRRAELNIMQYPDHTRRSLLLTTGVCSHAGCSMIGWLKAEHSDKDILKGFCHNSEFNPRESAQVAFVPALRPPAAPRLAIADGSLTVAATLLGKVGAQQPG
jgi:Rieske Fe-S protein